MSSVASSPGASWLVLDTATPIAGVGVVRGTGVLAEHRLSETRRHAEGLVDAIDRALLAAGVGLDEIAGVGVGVGPGSFIGVRTGIATAKGLCLGRGIPLVGVPTLVAIACSAALPAGRGLVVVDAKRGEVYAQLVEAGPAGGGSSDPGPWSVRPLEPPRPVSPADARARAASLAFVAGYGVDDVEGAALVRVPGPTAEGLARALAARIAGGVVDELDSLVPDYCRAPDAKLPAVDPGARRPTLP